MRFTLEHGQSENRIAVSEWMTAMMTIFFSVWWGYLFDSIQTIQTITIALKFLGNETSVGLSSTTIMLTSLAAVILFSVLYVHWLWNAQKFSTVKRYRGFLNYSIPLLFTLLGLVALVKTINLVSPTILSDSLAWYGVGLLIGWPSAVLAALLLRIE